MSNHPLEGVEIAKEKNLMDEEKVTKTNQMRL